MAWRRRYGCALVNHLRLIFRHYVGSELTARMIRPSPLSVLAGLVLAFSIAGLFSRAEAEPQEPLHFTCNDFPPHKIEHMGANQQRGFDIDIISEAFRRAG